MVVLHLVYYNWAKSEFMLYDIKGKV